MGGSNEPTTGGGFALISQGTIYSNALAAAIISQACYAPAGLTSVRCSSSYTASLKGTALVDYRKNTCFVLADPIHRVSPTARGAT